MDEIKIGAEIVFNITGNHNIGYAKGEKYIGTVLSKDHRSRLYVRTIGMPRACIDERIKAGYYSAENIEKRREEAHKAKMLKKRTEICERYDKVIREAGTDKKGNALCI